MLEIPLIVVDVQRGGPSTGLPTKTEQSDLNMAMFGRNGDSPLIIVAAKSPSDCFKMAFEAARLSLEHMTPVMLLSDGYIANGSTPWKIPDVDKEYPKIQLQHVDKSDLENGYLPYKRCEEKLSRKWAIPGMEGFMHRLGGLEKENETGNVSYDSDNHELMVGIRERKIAKVANYIPLQEVEGDKGADILIVSWGGTYGSVHQAIINSNNEARPVAHVHIQYLSPLPKNLGEILKSYKKVIVCELNRGQLRAYLNSQFSLNIPGYNKVQGKPFKVRELMQVIESYLYYGKSNEADKKRFYK
jgi:2-oxoglutarate ferredoxin oxidoreductase subunit alpha